ncbi:Receptor-like protein 12 [Morus notabilis]|uniref:Receptor-like protein 12 n=1 Tax=Morus notabilis TaxID=981085 RepID=W9QKH0_9ROSA|nr:receptor-like protein EIX1 [Morus notabilis]EXB29183.1 Receptor-like protein 12 [Morus notabilis]
MLSVLEGYKLNNFNSVLPDWIFSLSNLIRLDLYDSNFIGPFPNGSWILNSLTHLAAGHNYLSNSTIPSYLYGFPSLEYLDLSNNNLQGVLSSAIGNLTSISSLHLSNNSLKGELPMSTRNLCNLQTLDISYNQLNGSFPESLASLSNLTRLDIASNQLEGVVTEAHFVNLTRLSAFSASGNSLILRVSPDWIPPFHLRLLLMGSWNLGPQFPTRLKSQKDIQTVKLASTGISGIVPSWFWNLSVSFSYVNLCNNQLYGELPVQLPTSAFSVIYLCSNKFNGTIPRNSLHSWQLDLSNNSLSGDISEALCHPKVENDLFSPLTILNLGDNLLSGNIPDCWANWPSLLGINMGNNNLTGKIPSSMGSLQRLQLLYLRNNSLSGEIPSFLINCTALENLDLSLNEFVGGIPKFFGVGLSNLKILNLRSNKLNGQIPLELCRLTGLQVLDAAINNLSGTIPICFNNFSAMVTKNHSRRHSFIAFGDFFGIPSEKAYVVMKGREDMYAEIVSLVTSLDLSSNKLSGEIPKQLTSLQGLISLNLSGNHLRGNIPNEIGNMGSIISLDISRNLLSGKIPQSMANLNFLSNFNVSFNNLSGEIPLSTQLQSFNASSFIGNQLCGLPLPNKCRADHNTSVEDTEDEEGDKDEEEYWFRLGVAVGFSVGFLGVISPLVFYRFYRRAYYWFFQEYLWYKILDCYIKFKRVVRI